MRISWFIGATIYSYLKCIVHDKLLKPWQSFWITLYKMIFVSTFRKLLNHVTHLTRFWGKNIFGVVTCSIWLVISVSLFWTFVVLNVTLFIYLLIVTVCARGTWWCIWFRQCATSWKVAGFIRDGITDIFHWLNPSGCTVAMGSTRPLTEMNTRDIPGG